jgi:hypothetical protein
MYKITGQLLSLMAAGLFATTSFSSAASMDDLVAAA